MDINLNLKFLKVPSWDLLLILLYINDLTNVSIFYADTFYFSLMIPIFLH